MININQDNQIMKVSLYAESQEDDFKEGCSLQRQIGLSESTICTDFKALSEWLNSFGLDIEDFKRFNKNEEPNRLIFNRNEDREGNIRELSEKNPKGYLVDYDLYIEVYTLATDEDYLNNFEEVA